MTIILDTSDRSIFDPGAIAQDLNDYAYNGLDCCVTLEVFDELSKMLDDDANHVYNFELDQQAPVLEMVGRGILIDRFQRMKLVGSNTPGKETGMRKTERHYYKIIQKFAWAVWGEDEVFNPNTEYLNPASSQQLIRFFYGRMNIAPIKVRKKDKWDVSAGREALEKMSDYFFARPIAAAILAHRDVAKKIQTLTTEIDEDNRYRTSYNIGGTETGRYSSSKNAFGTGGNLQNITSELRICLVADRGMKLAYCDLQQAESRAVGLLAWLATGRSNYLDACESSDLHTVVSMLCWPTLPWPEDQKGQRALAEEKFYRMFSRRDLAKRGGHGSNYYGQPPTIAKNLQIALEMSEEFQRRYFKAFPEIPDWHGYTREQLMTKGSLITPFRRRRMFFDRLDKEATLRQAIAYVPQSMIADMVNRALLRIWTKFPQVQILLQVHDALVFQYPEHMEDDIMPFVLEVMRSQYDFNGRKFSIGSDAEVGWNWGKYSNGLDKKGQPDPKAKINFDGIRGYRPKDDRKRQVKPNDLKSALLLPF